jgi:hypothetical protein
MIQLFLAKQRKLFIGAVALASIITFEDAAHARTSRADDPPPASLPTQGLLDLGLSSGSLVREDVDASLRRSAICHISSHPRDGIRASLHACPLLFAAVGARRAGS